MSRKMRNRNVASRSAGRQYDFARMPISRFPRTKFGYRFRHITTFASGYMVPILTQEMLPGDTINISHDSLVRMITPIVPLMDNIYIDVLAFACPNRLVWDGWEGFITGQDDTTIPQVVAPASTGFAEKSLYDYMGCPTKVPDYSMSALFGRAHNLIYNEWIRDQNLQSEVSVPVDDGPDTYSDFDIYRRGKRHDYFTSMLPWPQKGDAVDIPLTGNAPVYGDGKALGLTEGSTNYGLGTTSVFLPHTSNYNQTLPHATGAGSAPATNVALGVVESGASGLVADLSSVSAITINALRQAIQYQGILELDARGGTRYVEWLLNAFGVTAEDYRLQRPEFLAGSSTRLTVAPVAQTSETGTTPQGNLAAFVVGGTKGTRIFKSFIEHSMLFVYVQVRADMTYQQGLHKQFSRLTRLDFYHPMLARLGEQAVLNSEWYIQGTSADADVAGYQERWAEYRYTPSRVSGGMRSNATDSFDVWNLAYDFSALPVLNSSFIEDNSPFERVTGVESSDQFYGDFAFSGWHARVMPPHSIPATLLTRI